MARGHPVTAVIEDAPGQQRLRFHPRGLVTVDLLTQFGLDGVEQALIHNGSLFASEDLALEGHLPDIEAIAKEVSQPATRKRDAADCVSSLQGADLADDALLAQVRHQQVEAAKLEIAAEDGPYRIGLGLVDGYLAVLRVIAKRRHAADPETLALGGCDLVADALRVTSRSNWANDSSTFKVSRPIEVVVLNCWVTDTNDTLCLSNSSTSLAKSASDRVRRSTL